MTPYCFVYRASCASLSRSTSGLQIGSRTFRDAAGQQVADLVRVRLRVRQRAVDRASGTSRRAPGSASPTRSARRSRRSARTARAPARAPSPCVRRRSGSARGTARASRRRRPDRCSRPTRIGGNGSASRRTESGLTPRFWSAALIITSPTPLSALTATVLPARSAGVLIELLPLTRMFCQLSASEVPRPRSPRRR